MSVTFQGPQATEGQQAFENVAHRIEIGIVTLRITGVAFCRSDA